VGILPRPALSEAMDKACFQNFKVGDYALFLPTKNFAKGLWATFNTGAPYYFLREESSIELGRKEWMIAHITKIEERVVEPVDLTKAANGMQSDADDENESPSPPSDNPFDLSDGIRWYLVDAKELRITSLPKPTSSEATTTTDEASEKATSVSG